jgi:hypothetical protein
MCLLISLRKRHLAAALFWWLRENGGGHKGGYEAFSSRFIAEKNPTR